MNKYTDLLMLVFLEAEAFRLHTRPHISLEPGRSVSGTWAILQLRNHRHRGRRLTRNRSNINQRKFHNRPSARTDCTFKVTPRPTDLFTSRAPQVLLRLFSHFFSFGWLFDFCWTQKCWKARLDRWQTPSLEGRKNGFLKNIFIPISKLCLIALKVS